MAKNKHTIRARQLLGKYRVARKIAEGGFAQVYDALDTIEGVRVALKVPHPHLMDRTALKEFRNEVRLTAPLEHPNILPIKSADFIDGLFVIASPLGDRTLADRMKNRLATRTALGYAEQMLEALAFAHRRRIIHCDVKPENCILFGPDRLRLADFGIAKVALRTLSARGTGTLGYVAPEQAMGKPSFRSDVFSLGLVLYQMFSGALPEWPYEWPPPGIAKVRRKLPPEMIEFIRRAIEVDQRRRFAGAEPMLAAFRRLKPRALVHQDRHTRRPRAHTPSRRDWKKIRLQDFQRRFGKALELNSTCGRCRHPVGETMTVCPWCGFEPKRYRGPSRFARRCRRCGRGMKLDWRFCPACYGPGVEPATTRRLPDLRYEARCENPSCKRKELMPFMRYCPWCRSKVARRWKIKSSGAKCARCSWGVVPEFWDWCPWCGKGIEK